MLALDPVIGKLIIFHGRIQPVDIFQQQLVIFRLIRHHHAHKGVFAAEISLGRFLAVRLEGRQHDTIDADLRFQIGGNARLRSNFGPFDKHGALSRSEILLEIHGRGARIFNPQLFEL